MTWIFVLGKNPELSAAEISCYFENRGVEVEFLDGSEQVLIVDAQIEDTEKAQFDLGGTLKIAEVCGEVGYPDFLEAFGRGVGKGRDKIGPLVPEVAVGSIYEYGERDVEELNLGNFKKWLNGLEVETKNPENCFSHAEVSKKGLVGEELVVGICENNVYFGVTQAVTSPFDYQKRDVGRPRPLLLGMSPSRAAILVNLVGVPDQVLLDPFCGGGTVGQEALLRGMLVILSDIDQRHVGWCRENLEWLRKYGKKIGVEIDFDERSIRQADARKLKGMKVDCIATEPYLGPAWKERPERREAERVMRNIGKLYEGFLKAAHGILKEGGKVALVCPVVMSGSGSLRLDIGKIANGCGFDVLIEPILDEEREKGKQRIVAREFVVLGQKSG